MIGNTFGGSAACGAVSTAIVPTRPVYPINYACGRCASGTFAADMTRAEAIRHAAMCHNVVILPRKISPLVLVVKN